MIERICLWGGDVLVIVVLGLLVTHTLWMMRRLHQEPLELDDSVGDLYRSRDQWMHLALVSLTVLLLRMPTWRLGEANIDESQWIAASLTLADRFALWGTVDPTTSGPLSLIWLTAWNVTFGDFSYHAAKVFTTIHAIAICLLFFVSLRSFARPTVALIYSAAFAILLGGLRLNDYVGYNGEQPTALIFAFAVALICHLQFGGCGPRQTRWLPVVLLGICLGALPYIKLQSVPMGMVFGLYGLWILRRSQEWVMLAGVVIAVQAAVLAGLYFTGWLHDFWITYIGENLFYAANHTPIPFLKRFYVFPIAWFRIIDGRLFGLGCFVIGAVLVVLLLLNRRSHLASSSKGRWSPLSVAAMYFAAACYAISQPGTFFDHYYFWLFHPAMLLIACLASAATCGRRPGRGVLLCSLAMLLVVLGCYIVNRTSAKLIAQNQRTIRVHSMLGQHLLELADDETKLAIWGWRPRLHVETQLPQATAESVSFRQLASVKYQEYFLNRYARQLKQHDDVLFIDLCGAGGSYWFGDETHRHENFLQIQEVIDQQFEPLGDYEGVKIYRTR